MCRTISTWGFNLILGYTGTYTFTMYFHNVNNDSGLRFSVGLSVTTYNLSTGLANINHLEWIIFSGILKDKSSEQFPFDTAIHISNQ